ncbi:hypothetical protein FHX44_115930 [Pseudonocardia hierapolitana]|uniref:Uncharacterized protein n=1 Tax=Pseudonocardia hierapolitana TaxID=1128676 RepID=A0A561SYT5_9PSEU|nr:hypothetical protein [Pseudonocardia hierapolitana]TWF79993.1 hypothetical protein FHX44_115930 [Pseudonocardia hierapolitana]
MTVPVGLGPVPCEQSDGSTGDVFRVAFVQVLIGVMSFSYPGPAAGGQTQFARSSHVT